MTTVWRRCASWERRWRRPTRSTRCSARVYSPCALGAVIRPETIGRLRCKVIAGAANNQLADAAMGDELKQRGVVYAPDFAINAGGVIDVGDELIGDGYDPARAPSQRGADRANAGRRVRARPPRRRRAGPGGRADGARAHRRSQERRRRAVIPLHDTIPTRNRPVVTVALILINVVVFLFELFGPRSSCRPPRARPST